MGHADHLADTAVGQRHVGDARAARAHESEAPRGRRQRRPRIAGHADHRIGNAAERSGVEVQRDDLTWQQLAGPVRVRQRPSAAAEGHDAGDAGVAAADGAPVAAVGEDGHQLAASGTEVHVADQATARRPDRVQVLAVAGRQRPRGTTGHRAHVKVGAAARLGPGIDNLTAVRRETGAGFQAGLGGKRPDRPDAVRQHVTGSPEQVHQAEHQRCDQRSRGRERDPAAARAVDPVRDGIDRLAELHALAAAQAATRHGRPRPEAEAVAGCVFNSDRPVLGEHPAQKRQAAAEAVIRHALTEHERREERAGHPAGRRGMQGEHAAQRRAVERDQSVRAGHAPYRGPHSPAAELKIRHRGRLRQRLEVAYAFADGPPETHALAGFKVGWATLHRGSG